MGEGKFTGTTGMNGMRITMKGMEGRKDARISVSSSYANRLHELQGLHGANA